MVEMKVAGMAMVAKFGALVILWDVLSGVPGVLSSVPGVIAIGDQGGGGVAWKDERTDSEMSVIYLLQWSNSQLLDLQISQRLASFLVVSTEMLR